MSENNLSEKCIDRHIHSAMMELELACRRDIYLDIKTYLTDVLLNIYRPNEFSVSVKDTSCLAYDEVSLIWIKRIDIIVLSAGKDCRYQFDMSRWSDDRPYILSNDARKALDVLSRSIPTTKESLHDPKTTVSDRVRKMNHWAFAIIQLLKVRCQNDRFCDAEMYLRHLIDSSFLIGEKCVTAKIHTTTHPLTKITYRGLELNFSVITDSLYSYTIQLIRVHEEDHYRLTEESEAFQKRLV